jgi:trimeric autotransporter adhesin
VNGTLASQGAFSVTGVPAGPLAYGSTFAVGSSGGSGNGAVTFAAAGACSASGSTITMTSGSGVCSVTATKAADGNYSSISSTSTVNATTAPVTFTLTVTPNPSILGQSLTVKFVGVTPTAATGSVTVRDVTGASCTGAVSGGTGSCVLTLPILTSTGKSVVGKRTLTATFTDSNGNYAGGPFTTVAWVQYNFVGFLAPIKLAAYSGTYNLGKSLPIKWQLLTNSGAVIGMTNLDLTKVSLIAYFNGAPVNNVCPVNDGSAVNLVLYNSISGAPGNSSFKFGSNQFTFNWDTSVNLGKGCYTIKLSLDDATIKETSLQLQ